MAILTAQQIADFKRNGFVILRGLFAPDEIAGIAAWCDEIVAWPEVPGRHMMYYEDSRVEPGVRVLQRAENIYPYHAGFQALFDEPRLKGAVAELLGEPAVLYKDKINFKLPGGGGFELHQDQQAGWNAYADYFITAMVSIDESTVENGCLELAAGFHDRGLIGEEWKPLSEAETAGMDFVPFPTKPGDVAFFDSYAPHGSGPNRTERSRRILYITYNRTSAGDHRERYYADKRKGFPPDCEREPGKQYTFRV